MVYTASEEMGRGKSSVRGSEYFLIGIGIMGQDSYPEPDANASVATHRFM
jgi:hypothetical protein